MRVGDTLAFTFHALRGDIRYEQGRFDDAIINYNRAIERDLQKSGSLIV